jgi:membrane protease YdiL (CAAX protease family)
MSESVNIKPMPFGRSLLFFGIPAVIIYAMVYYVWPLLLKIGVSLFWGFILVMLIPAIALFIVSLAAYKWEGHILRWNDFKQRYRLRRMRVKEWLWVLAVIVVSMAAGQLLAFSARWLATLPLFAPPEYIPALLNPSANAPSGAPEFLGLILKGQWWLVPLLLIVWFFNIFGEEFWWRGYIMPRQEMVHGKWTWVVHGLLWTLFHFVWKWNLIVMLPACLSLSFAVQKTKNTWIGIFVHFVMNGMALVPLISGIIG